MKFESEFGLGEVVSYTKMDGSGHIVADELMEVVGITFNKTGVMYSTRGHKGMIFHYDEHDLVGDSDFNQETGKYDDEDI